MNTYAPCNFIRDFKTHATDVICKAVRIFLKNTVNRISVFLIDFCPQIQGDPIFLQKHHCFSHICLFFHLSSDLAGLFFTDSLDLSQTLGLFFHDPKSICPKPADDPGSQSRSDPLNSPGAKVALHCHGILRHFFCKRGDLKLFSINMMIDKISGSLNGGSLTDYRKSSHTGQFLIVAFCSFQNKNRISVVFISEYNMVNISCYAFTHLTLPFLLLLQHIFRFLQQLRSLHSARSVC